MAEAELEKALLRVMKPHDDGARAIPFMENAVGHSTLQRVWRRLEADGFYDRLDGTLVRSAMCTIRVMCKPTSVASSRADMPCSGVRSPWTKVRVRYMW